jgi:hypothetical protein
MNRGSSKGWDQLEPLAAALLFAALSNTAFAQGDRGPSKPPIILESTGAYEVGGKILTSPMIPIRHSPATTATSNISSRRSGAWSG